jgi:cell wall-associated NlpC family hydrolase
MFSAEIETAAKAHAIAQYPKESCGIVAGNAYVPLDNKSDDPENFFKLPDGALATHAPVAAVVHSHCRPKHGQEPTAPDMTSQIEAALPFGIVWTDGKTAYDPIWWGDFLLDAPLFDAKGNHIPREFMHGVNDCFSLIRTWYWQEKKIKLPEFPRDNDWWAKGGDLYQQGFGKAGFEVLAKGPHAPHGVMAGDIVLMKWGKFPVPFHAGIVLAGGLVLHHLNGRLSRREPLVRWRNQVTHWLRRAEPAPIGASSPTKDTAP